MKKLLALLAACVFSCAALSAEPVKDNALPKMQTKPIETNTPTGPMGILGLKIGITKDAVEALTATDEVFLAEQLVEKAKSPRHGTMYMGKLKTPLYADSLPISMVFDGEDTLTIFRLDLPEDITDGVEKQLIAKYGAPKVEEKNEEEQCIYKNGANFKLQKKERKATWITLWKDSVHVETTIMSLVTPSCPGNLRYENVSATNINRLSFIRKKSQPTTQLPRKDIF